MIQKERTIIYWEFELQLYIYIYTHIHSLMTIITSELLFLLGFWELYGSSKQLPGVPLGRYNLLG